MALSQISSLSRHFSPFSSEVPPPFPSSPALTRRALKVLCRSQCFPSQSSPAEAFHPVSHTIAVPSPPAAALPLQAPASHPRHDHPALSTPFTPCCAAHPQLLADLVPSADGPHRPLSGSHSYSPDAPLVSLASAPFQSSLVLNIAIPGQL